jgi:hypothetical protein
VAPGGILPSYKGFQSEVRSALVEGEQQSRLIGGSIGEGYWSHDLGLGLPWRPLQTEGPALQATEHQFHRIARPGSDLLVGVRGADQGLSGFQVGNQNAVMYQVDPATGEIVCGEVAKGGGAVKAAAVHPTQNWFTVGSKWGSLMARDDGHSHVDCEVHWDQAGLEVGSRLNLDVAPFGRGWMKGPVIVKVEIVVELEGGREVSLYFLDGVFRSPGPSVRETVMYAAVLHYWWWENNVYGQIESW